MLFLIFYLLLILIIMLIASLIKITRRMLYKLKIDNLLEKVRYKEDLLYSDHRDLLYIAIEVFKRKGYQVQMTDRCGEDYNGLILDGILFVEVWKDRLNHAVEIETAMKLAKCMRSNAIYRGMLITLGDFKQNTRLFCYSNVIKCINGDQFLSMCKEVQNRKQEWEPIDGITASTK